MSNLLQQVVEAHGGLRHWEQLSDLVTEVEVDGQLCPRFEVPTAIPRTKAFFSLRRQNIVMLDELGSQKFLIEPNLVSFSARRGDQAESMSAQTSELWRNASERKWDLLRTAYVQGFAIRHYVTAPFLYSTPGFSVEEVEPWQEDGETWRVLKIIFPPHIQTRARVQFAYFGDDGLLRRTRYNLQIEGGYEVASYVSEYDRVNGIWLPISRELLACDAAGHKRSDHPIARIRLLNSFFSE